MNFVKELLKKTFSRWADRTDYFCGLFKFIVIEAICIFGFGWTNSIYTNEDSTIAMVIVSIVVTVLLVLVEVYVAVGSTGLTYRRFSDVVLPAPVNAKIGTIVYVAGVAVAVIFNAMKSITVVFSVLSIIGAVVALVPIVACLLLPGKWDYRKEAAA